MSEPRRRPEVVKRKGSKAAVAIDEVTQVKPPALPVPPSVIPESVLELNRLIRVIPRTVPFSRTNPPCPSVILWIHRRERSNQPPGAGTVCGCLEPYASSAMPIANVHPCED